MPPLYLTQQLAKIRIRKGRLLVEQDGETLAHLPLGHISEVVLFGNIGLSTPAIGMLLAKGIEVVFLSEDGRFKGRLTAGLTPHVPLRKAQYRALDDPAFHLELARGLVQAKLRHQRALLQRHNRERSDPHIAASIARLQDALAELPRRSQLSSLRGHEGAAAAAYFGGLRHLFDPAWRFESRNRRPPRDPVNVLLSLGYTLLTQIASSAVQTVGLDPYAGFLHEVVYNRPALGLDLVEEFRPVVDGIVLWTCNSGQVTPADFTPGPPERPVVLSAQGRKRFLLAFEQRLETRYLHPIRQERLTLRQCLIEQARQIADRLQKNEPGFTGMGFR
ncbi:MAG: CRISPR-associated endonuclease Cas1 [Anaerolineales bacterium]